MRPNLPWNTVEPNPACPPGQPKSLARALFAAIAWMARKAEQRMSTMQTACGPAQTASAAMAQQRRQQATPQAATLTAAVIPTAVAFAPVRSNARGLRNSKGDFSFKKGS